MNMLPVRTLADAERSTHAGPAGRGSWARSFRALLSLALCSCSWMVDTDKIQCSSHDDCTALFGAGPKLACIDQLCAQPSCERDEDCAGFGPAYEGTVCEQSSCVAPESVAADAGEDADVEPLDPAWACLEEPLPAPSPPGLFNVTMHLQHMATQVPMAGVTGRLCRKIDVTCESPSRMAVSDESGDISIEVEANFTGYVSLTRDDLMPTSYFFNPAIREDTTLSAVQLAPAALAAGLVTQLAGTYDSERGLILLAAYDCTGSGAAGVTFSSNDADDSTVVFYSSGGLPSKTTVETEMSGYGGFVNARPGPFVIAGQRASDQQNLGELSVLVKAGELTITRFFPTPPR